MEKPVLPAVVVFILVLSSFAQRVEPGPVPAPADIILELGTEGGEHQFHLGELIPVKFSYRANVPGRYIWTGNGRNLAGGTLSKSSARLRQSASNRTQRYLTI
jgi:hypothetical protein